ncbi:uncharacterized protein LOC143021003 isoform X1 [Oratosquilla oratoria]|uniref:uncharacterized protein LOC143021003 isoform X1 n=1 Tax=Oratosquilla oratoria TaxID=337810 RepID=UPI003F7697D3
MGSPLSAVLANLFMEFLETGPFANIVPEHVTWLRYVDDILLVTPRRFNLHRLQTALNEVEPTIQFSLKEEIHNSLPFLDTNIFKYGNQLEFKVYRKPTNKKYLIHFYSHHDIRTKIGVVIGIFLRAFRICSAKYLEEECRFIKETFLTLKFPEFLLDNCRQQTAKIWESSRQQDNTTRRLVLPTSDGATNLTHLLRTTNLEVVCQTSRTIKDTTKTKIHNNQTPGTKAVIYHIPCSGCDKVYIGETSRDLNTRIREHRYDVRHDVTTNACVTHRNKENHLMDWKNVELLIREPDKIRRKCLETAIIQGTNTIEQNRGMFNISPHIISLIPMASKILNI